MTAKCPSCGKRRKLHPVKCSRCDPISAKPVVRRPRTVHQEARRVLENVAPSKLKAYCDKRSGPELGALSDALDGLIQHAAWIGGYIDMRHGNGCGDQGHKFAVREANTRLAKIRKALGYTSPRRDIHV